MKKMFLFIALAGVLGCAGVPINKFDPATMHVEFIDDHQLPKDQAFVAADIWIAKNFNSSKTVIQTKDKEAGIIILKAVYPFFSMGLTEEYADYIVDIRVKDNKIKHSFDVGTYGDGKLYPPAGIIKKMKATTFLNIREGINQSLKPAADF